MKILFIGDIVGSPGREMLGEYLPKLKAKYRPDHTIVNAENAAHGKGITKKIYHELLQAGADLLTMGNHTWDKKDIFEFIEEADYLVRPANFPSGTPGSGLKVIGKGKNKAVVINLQGTTFLPPLDNPFHAADRLIEEAKQHAPVIFIDFHAEATSEKQALAWYLDGRCTAVIGTHTHVPTNDSRILPGGTAFQADAGMTGPYDGILGMKREAVLNRFLTQLPARFEVEEGKTQLNGVFIEADQAGGKATSIKPIQINDDKPFFD
ncbi:TIGR00282 family metallophosphoesterase [Bacillus daqingensis]|uniref:TIGR00282 family metallophosphoesterase n=1 Tax=Bacillus daqingensis TaxID=872396 RepID=A0ABV9NTM7_9BACI